MSVDYNDKYIFRAEWYDTVAHQTKEFYLYYYPYDNSVKLYNLKNDTTFLRRTKCKGIQAKDFYVGATVNIFTRYMKIIDYADPLTRAKLQKKTQKTCALLKSDMIHKVGEIMKEIIKLDFRISNVKMIKLTQAEATEFYSSVNGSDKMDLINHLTSGPVVALELMGDNSIARWIETIGPDDSEEAQLVATSSLRARYGKDKIFNAIHGSKNSDMAKKEIEFFFPNSKSERKAPTNTATLENCTCCVIKPHAVRDNLIGDIIEDIQKAGYTISALEQFCLNPFYSEEFLEVYKGVIPTFKDMVRELQSGPCVAMEITHTDQNIDVVAQFRILCGPMDPQIARQVSPNSLRAKYGKNAIQNGVHCCDLQEDGILEVEFFFKLLSMDFPSGASSLND
ncbi:hypothetical protein KM043_007777 [Ampulex compressa]|nr:hypothetical protein KM043_007777 [Ampulex compressa]